MANLARRAGVSEPTVTRFSRAVGCTGLRELKVKLAQSLVVGRIYLEEPPHVGDDRGKPTTGSRFSKTSTGLSTARSASSSSRISTGRRKRPVCSKLVPFRRRRRFNHARRRGQVSVFSAWHCGVKLFRRRTDADGGRKPRQEGCGAGDLDDRKAAEIIDAVTIAKEYGATIIAITKPNSPLATLADISLGLYVPETPNALKPTASRYAFLAAIDLLAATFAYRNPRETQERMRRIKYALVNAGNGDTDGPLGD